MKFRTKLKASFLCSAFISCGVPSQAVNTNYTTSWVGNSLGGVNQNHIPQNTYAMYVTPGGVVYTASGYEEGSYSEIALDTNGNLIGTTGGTYGGDAVAVDSGHQYTVTFDFGAGKRKLTRYPLGTGGSLGGENSSDGDSISWGDAPTTNIDIRGMAINGSELFISDVTNGKIVVFNTSTLHTVRSWNVSFPPGAITIDGSGNLWVVERLPTRLDSNGNVQDDPTGVKVHCFTPGSGSTAGSEITARAISGIYPSGLAYDSAHNRLLVADNGPDEQVKAYTNLGGTPSLDTTFFSTGRFGYQGGIYAGSTPGLLTDPAAGGANRFHALTGVGVDSSGNIYVAMDGHYASAFNTDPTPLFSNLYGETDIRKFSSSGQQTWQRYGNEFTQGGCIDPGTDGADLYTLREHFTLDLSKSPGQEGTFTSYTVGRFNSPYTSDPFRTGGAGGGEDSFIVRLSGKKFMIVGGSAIYKPDGELWRPCGYIYRTNQYTPQNALYGSGSYRRVKWYDANNDGIVQTSEITNLGIVDIAEPPMIDAHGDWWVAGEGPSSHLPTIHKYAFQGLDANGIPMYDNGTDYTVPSMFVDSSGNGIAQLSQIYYDQPNDVMYLSGYTASYPDDGNEHRVIARFNSWSTGNRTAAYTVVMPSDTLNFPDSNRIDSFDIAGGYIFAQASNSHVHVYDKSTGSSTEIVTLVPGSIVGGYTGANDNGIRVHAFMRSTGEYLVACEENLYNKVIFYRWNPGGTIPTAATPTFSPAGGTFTSAQSVTISDSISGSTIRYTTDGSTPTSSSALYSSPIVVSATATLKAVAFASGYNNSAIGSATYTINTGGGGTATVYEAESGTLAGTAQVYSSTAASNGQFVGNFQVGASDTITGVNGGTGGSGSLVITYTADSSKRASLYVNGVFVQKINWGSGTYGTWRNQAAITIPLNSGTGNTIKISQDSDDSGSYVCADIDKITVTPGGGGGGSAPSAPTGLTATAGNAQVALSWAATSGATSYNVYRGTTAGGESATAVATGVTTTSYTNTGLTNATKYYFTVKAVNASGTSGASNEVNATPTAPITTTYEAESGTLAGTAQVYTDSARSGGKFVGNFQVGASDTIGTVNGGASGGSATLVITYTADSSKRASLYINGTFVQKINWGAGTYGTWRNQAAITINLNSGTGNTIKISQDSDDSGSYVCADIDKIAVTK